MGITYSLFGASTQKTNYADTLYSINDEDYNVMVHNLQEAEKLQNISREIVNEVINQAIDNIIETNININENNEDNTITEQSCSSNPVSEISPAMSFIPEENENIPEFVLESNETCLDAPNKIKKKKKKKNKKK